MTATTSPARKGWRPNLPGIEQHDASPMMVRLGGFWMAGYNRLPKKAQEWILGQLSRKAASFSHEWIVGRRNRKNYSWATVREAMAKTLAHDGAGSPPDFDALLPWMFHHGMASRGICQMDIDEALALWKLCRENAARLVVEIGRFKGGSTFLLACAMGEAGRLISFDLNDQHDAEFASVLQATGLAHRVELIVGDSRSSGLDKTVAADLVFVDGGHSREDVIADVRAWYPALKPGGIMCFHDAAQTRANATAIPSVVETVNELFTSSAYGCVRIVEAGSLVAFRKNAGQARTS